MYSSTNKCIGQNRQALLSAFYEITGTKPDEIETAVHSYLTNGGKVMTDR